MLDSMDRPVARRCGREWLLAVALAVGAGACSGDLAPSATSSIPAEVRTTPSAQATSRVEGDGTRPVLVGAPIDVESLGGRIVFDDFEDMYVMNADGSDVRPVAAEAGPEFDGAWSPDGAWIVYRDSTRGINEDDEIFVVGADGSGRRNLTQHPANDWGPEWSPDGTTIVFNSDRDGVPLSGYLVAPDGSNLRRIDTEVWVEYATFSPDGTRIAFAGHAGSDYDIYVAELATGTVKQLTDAPGGDGWPAWSPDGSTIAFSSERDDCIRTPPGADCWRTGAIGEHHDIWLMDPDGGNQRRLSPEYGHFVTWSPDGRYVLVSGHALYVVRPDGTGRAEIRGEGMPLPLGGIPDWSQPP